MPIQVDEILADLKSQEIRPELHPVLYSPWQVRVTLLRFLEDYKECLKHLAKNPVYHPKDCSICTRVQEILK